jgi:hypothetical protein
MQILCFNLFDDIYIGLCFVAVGVLNPVSIQESAPNLTDVLARGGNIFESGFVLASNTLWDHPGFMLGRAGSA